MAETVLYEAAEGVATLTLNRPDRLNTIGPVERERRHAVGGLVQDGLGHRRSIDRDPSVRFAASRPG